uniref:L-aminopeptidase/D-esterase n=1 Tax=Candidatus Kentrum eta TaxID=2126337 RepID=A0A450UIY9_9GAMM|nr:MAG: L-aminopeptidase/D-esterase [Candidatus Kentron sp. H]VFJ93413.1 MAG: L-aminopeptidase/D-esterase [Candidatus Kentron sp. H]VFK00220.1 MAG: L-aminopeptidase/D-esterase [Candidatus Kentron sp. H]
MSVENRTLTAIPGIAVGHYEDRAALCGVTVLRFLSQEGAIASVDVRGSAPGTRETDLLDPINTIQRVHAIVLTGGSGYGLEAAGVGYRVGPGLLVPIVPAAVIFDLSLGDSRVRPTKAWGYQACESASRDPLASGNVGAGLGATVGKVFGARRRMKGGLGSFVIGLPGGIKVGALVVVNAFGDIVNPENGEIVAGARGARQGAFIDTTRAILESATEPDAAQVMNTTLGVVATNARLDKTQLRKIAQTAHDGLARTIRPVHTLFDGDTIFAVSAPAGDLSAGLMAVAVAAERALERAVLLAVETAETVPGAPAARDWNPK